MKTELLGINLDYETGEYNMTFTCPRSELANIETLKGVSLELTVKEWKKKRSLNANALMWVCLGEIADVLRVDKWEVYLQMLRRYGRFTYVAVRPSVVDAVKRQWRECEEVGEININGQKAIQLLCYFGSSTYDTKEFSILLDGIFSEMKELGIPTPADEELERALKEWEKNQS